MPNTMLFSPITINGMVVRNRFVRSATVESLCKENGRATPELAACWRKLAAGGVGLLISGCLHVSEKGRGYFLGGGLCHDDQIPDLANAIKAAHEHGAKVAIQLYHSGRQTSPAYIGGSTPLAPSALPPDPFYKVTPRAMTVDEIHETIEAFVQAAKRAKTAGADAVQLHGAHGYLISAFLSPYTNKRTDEWGGSLENRMRFVVEIFNRMRQTLGKNYPIMIKVNAEDGVENGLGIEEGVLVAKRLAGLGMDAIEISGGILVDSMFMIVRGDVPIDYLTAPIKDPVEKANTEAFFYSIKDVVAHKEAYWLAHAEKIKPAIGKTPLILVGGMKYPQTMEKILTDGKADMISLCRPLIKEPDLPNQIANGRRSPVKCSSCNRCTFEICVLNKPLRCYNLS